MSADGRRTIPITTINEREFVALDDLASRFQLTIRQEAGATTVTYKGGTIILTPEQPLASVSGKLISLPAAPTRSGGRLLVPLEFIPRALAPIYGAPLDLRRPSRLLVVGNLRVPRVAIRAEALANAWRLVVETTPRTTATVSEDGDRLSIRFDADALDLDVSAVQAPGFIRAIQSGDAATVTVDLGPRYATYRSSTQTSDSSSRLTLDLLSLSANAGTAIPSAPTPAAPPPTAAADPRLFEGASAGLRTLVIDPGHGGEDHGARGANGTTEKDLTLAVARRLKSIVEGSLGIRVLLTRDDDRNVPLDRRTAAANNNKADVFISLHANASPLASTSGASIRVAAFDPDERARAGVSSGRVPIFGGGSRAIDLVVWDLAQVRHTDRSTELATIVAQQLQGKVPMDIRPTGSEPFRVLESANMPAVLIEMGYLSNADQERLLAGSQFQDTFARALFDSLLRFRDTVRN